VEPRWLAVRRHEVRLSQGAGAPINVLQLSDFHASPEVSLDFIGRAVAEGTKLKPDLICITGDFITGRYDNFQKYAEALKPLADTAPALAVLGNHDGGRWVGRHGYEDTENVRRLLSGSRITLLHNQSTEVPVGGRSVYVAGVGDLWAGELDGQRSFAVPPSRGAIRILLAHNPDSKDALGHQPWDLMLSGHTHGGQVDLVFLGTPFAPVRDRRYVRGLGKWNDRWIHVTAGVGNLHGLRLNCRPDVSLLTIT
jgi:predicted MPP superfamily phosphohydrolase